MTHREMIRELYRLTSRILQPEDRNIAGWEQVCTVRIEAIRDLLDKIKEGPGP